MCLRLVLILLLMVLAMNVETSSITNDVSWNSCAHYNIDSPPSHNIENCNGRVGDCIDEAEEMMMDSEASRQTLALGQTFVSYRAFKKDHVPCNHRGLSYYTCNIKGRDFP
ncbi:unnamed protein product [Ilex paraguariensis]|uniref:Rapid ALkalinization Factor n=1 Tax=Ilex paraguariensis TaxID=185542 RepID=A0ABC8ULE3_9AQUA